MGRHAVCGEWLQVQVPNKYGRRALILLLCLFHLAFLLFARVMLSPQLAAQTAPGAQHIWIRGWGRDRVCEWVCVCVCVCVYVTDRELVFVCVCWAGGQHCMYGHSLWTMRKMPSVSQHDGVNSQAGVAAHKQKHMEEQRIIKILFPLARSPTETQPKSKNGCILRDSKSVNYYPDKRNKYRSSRKRGKLPVGNETDCVLHAYILNESC